MKKYKPIVMFILSLFVGQALTGVASAYDYSQGFIEYYGLSGITSAKSPLRSSTDITIDIFSNVNSNNNQPRYINGTADLHNGTDLRAAAGTPIYPILDGYVTAKHEPSSTSNNGYVTIRHVVDGISYYVRYYHINPEDNIIVGQFVSQYTLIAKVDTAKSWPAHLDFGQKDASPTGKSIKLYPFYRWVNAWDLGSSLEWFSGDVHSFDNMFYISCVNANTTGATPCSSVKIHYRVGSSTLWNSKDLTQISAGSTRWKIDFDMLGFPGQTIYYYIAGTRNDNNIYYWGYYPQYYKFPGGPTLSDAYANNIVRSYTIK